ncbi:MAG: class I SAM-dependent methyltransferase [Tepidisphaeraceae bacterium]|jgi:SAM-dependent methyltransferase
MSASKPQHPAHRKFIGPPDRYDLNSAMQFNLLTALGLREEHTVLDIGCGSLRAGRLLITYLKPGKYFGIEPEQWLIDEGIDCEIGRDMIRIKQPTFNNDTNFTLTSFGKQFDFIIAQSIFSHASVAQIRRCLSEAKKSLAATGVFAATIFPGETNYDGTEWVYPGCVKYTLEYFAKVVAEEGMAAKPLDWMHPKGQKWFAITHPGHAPQEITDTGRITILQHEVKALNQEIAKLKSLHGLKLLKKLNRAVKGKK